MKSLSIKNLKNLREHEVVLMGNYGVTALLNPNGSIAYRFQKRIKGRNAFEGTLGYYPQMSIKDAEKEALRLVFVKEDYIQGNMTGNNRLKNSPVYT